MCKFRCVCAPVCLFVGRFSGVFEQVNDSRQRRECNPINTAVPDKKKKRKSWPFFSCASGLIFNPALLYTTQNTNKFLGTAHPGNTGLAVSLTGLLWLSQFGLSLLWPRDCSETVEIPALFWGLSQNHRFVSVWVCAGRRASYYFTNLWIRKSRFEPLTSH